DPRPAGPHGRPARHPPEPVRLRPDEHDGRGDLQGLLMRRATPVMWHGRLARVPGAKRLFQPFAGTALLKRMGEAPVPHGSLRPSFVARVFNPCKRRANVRSLSFAGPM